MLLRMPVLDENFYSPFQSVFLSKLARRIKYRQGLSPAECEVSQQIEALPRAVLHIYMLLVDLPSDCQVHLDERFLCCGPILRSNP